MKNYHFCQIYTEDISRLKAIKDELNKEAFITYSNSFIINQLSVTYLFGGDRYSFTNPLDKAKTSGLRIDSRTYDYIKELAKTFDLTIPMFIHNFINYFNNNYSSFHEIYPKDKQLFEIRPIYDENIVLRPVQPTCDF
jgi:hypothetical protein